MTSKLWSMQPTIDAVRWIRLMRIPSAS
jgi:hypothetical protein